MEFPAGRRGHTALSWYDTLHQKPVYLDGQVARRQRHLEETQEQSALREAINNAFNFGDPTRPQLDEMRPILRKEVRDQRIGWLIIAWDRWSSDAVPEKSLRKRCRALTKLIRGTLLLDGDFVPSLADSSWGDNGNILRCPTEQVSAWASLPRRKQRSAPAILLVVKLRWE